MTTFAEMALMMIESDNHGETLVSDPSIQMPTILKYLIDNLPEVAYQIYEADCASGNTSFTEGFLLGILFALLPLKLAGQLPTDLGTMLGCDSSVLS